MTGQDKFLALYKEYEGLLRSMNMDSKEVEDAQLEQDANRLRMCRQFRNYFAHVQDPGFLEPTKKMFDFLQKRTDVLKMNGDIVKKHLKKPECCILRPADKIADAVANFSKLRREELLVAEEDGKYSLLSVYETICFPGRGKISVTKRKLCKVQYCGPMEPMENLDNSRVWLCTQDGTAEGKLLGQVWF